MSDQADAGSERRQEAAQWWAQYAIPIAFDVAIKGRRSGLLRGSSGTGRARDTVNHFYVEETFDEGRLSREAGSFLCDPNANPRHEFTGERERDDLGEYRPKITCSTCKERMQRWRRDDAE